MSPLISIVIPYFNTGKSLKALLGTILASDLKDFEILCVNDCSTDDSEKVAKEMNDKRIVWLKTEHNSGPSGARNLGIQHSKGKYLFFLDSDDEISEHYFERMLGAIAGDAVLAVCGIQQRFLDRDLTVDKYCTPASAMRKNESFKEYILRLMILDGRLYSALNKVFDGEVVRKNELRFSPHRSFAEDTKFVLDYLGCFEASEAKIAFVPEPLYHYNYGTTTSVIAKTSLYWENWEKSYDDILRWLSHEPTKSEKPLLRAIRQRFKMSHAMAVARSGASAKEKLKYTKAGELLLAEVVKKIRG